MSGLLLFNPLELVEQLIVLVVLVLLVIFMVKYWDRILMAITGDDRIHGTFLDCIWFSFFRCCGVCTCDWTRCVSRHCLCLPARLRGANLVKRLGQCLGITTAPVELKNIVVGDLPWERRANFYLSVECEANPPMMSSVAEAQLPKVVHFPEVLSLRLRYSLLEEKVRITVKELNLLGSTDLCVARIGAMHILDWAADPKECMKRIEMTPCNHELQWETQPWILVEFGEPHDDRDLEHFHAMGSKVRTATKDGYCEDLSVREFKEDYTLLDPSGHAMAEPLEDDLDGIAWRVFWVTNLHWALVCWGSIGFAAFWMYDMYVRTCWKRYSRLTMARLNHVEFPASTTTLFRVNRECKRLVEGSGQQPGVPCLPSEEQVLDTCTPASHGGKMPEQQPPILAFEGLIERYTSHEGWGIPCNELACAHKVQLQAFDFFTMPAFVAFLLFTICCRLCGNQMVRQHQLNLQRNRALETRRFMKETRETNKRPSMSLF